MHGVNIIGHARGGSRMNVYEEERNRLDQVPDLVPPLEVDMSRWKFDSDHEWFANLTEAESLPPETTTEQKGTEVAQTQLEILDEKTTQDPDPDHPGQVLLPLSLKRQHTRLRLDNSIFYANTEAIARVLGMRRATIADCFQAYGWRIFVRGITLILLTNRGAWRVRTVHTRSRFRMRWTNGNCAEEALMGSLRRVNPEQTWLPGWSKWIRVLRKATLPTPSS
jgi:hypothetical protein